MNDFSRRRFFHLAGTMGAVASQQGFRLNAQQQYPAPVPAPTIFPYTSRSPVSLVKGDVRRKNVLDALLAVDKEVRPAMARKKYVLIKINNVSTTNQLAATHVDAIRGILDYVAPRFKGPVVIAEASSRDSMEGFENFKYAQVIPNSRPSTSRYWTSTRKEVRGVCDCGPQHSPHSGAAGRPTDGPGCIRHLLGDVENSQRRGGHRFREEHGAGRPAAQLGR